MLLVLAALIVGCSKEKEKEEEKKEPATAEVPAEVEKKTYITPFTGVEVDKKPTMRPVMVTINNQPQARPQSGLTSADLIYEMVAEGNITRILAVFQSELPENIGPVRSARDYFVDLAKGLDAFYIAHGYSPEAKSMLTTGVVDNINGMQYDGSLFKRSADRVAPHNSYISEESVKLGEEKVDAALKLQKKVPFSFYESVEDVKIDKVISKVDIRYGSDEQFHNTFTYNEDSKLYERQSGGVVTKDLLNDESVQVANVLFFEINHSTVDQKGRQALDLASGGSGYVFQAGQKLDVKWRNVDGVLLPYADDKPVKLVPGKSWINFVPSNPGLAKLVTYKP
ncbi:DUF3048 domain-containing protein [Viridibacillus sp. YIM B01967]|uniref:DUF3048 domain-containing protein n=2 Tax=Viridibacillus soli TaxID=2798301 RepID=A0ABS1H8I3_9BACL|nr:DUF3048 domain-containing protein [Viridibacillus soli]